MAKWKLESKGDGPSVRVPVDLSARLQDVEEKGQDGRLSKDEYNVEKAKLLAELKELREAEEKAAAEAKAEAQAKEEAKWRNPPEGNK